MKKLYKVLAAASVTGAVALAVIGGMYGVNYYTGQKEARAAIAESKLR